MTADEALLSDMWLTVAHAAPNAAEFACAAGNVPHDGPTRVRDDVASDSRATARVRRETEMRAEKRIRHAGRGQAESAFRQT